MHIRIRWNYGMAEVSKSLVTKFYNTNLIFTRNSKHFLPRQVNELTNFEIYFKNGDRQGCNSSKLQKTASSLPFADR
jgi:hypothetical protein